jgi:hypothetical protein
MGQSVISSCEVSLVRPVREKPPDVFAIAKGWKEHIKDLLEGGRPVNSGAGAPLVFEGFCRICCSRLCSLLASIYDDIAGLVVRSIGVPEKDEERRVVNSKVLSCLLSFTS